MVTIFVISVALLALFFAIKSVIVKPSVIKTVKKYDEKRKQILIAGIIVAILIGLFPPWILTFSYSTIHYQRPAGYAFIATPYKLQSYQKLQYTEKEYSSIKIDFLRLFLEWMLVLLATGVSILLTSIKNKKPDSNNHLRE